MLVKSYITIIYLFTIIISIKNTTIETFNTKKILSDPTSNHVIFYIDTYDNYNRNLFFRIYIEKSTYSYTVQYFLAQSISLSDYNLANKYTISPNKINGNTLKYKVKISTVVQYLGVLITSNNNPNYITETIGCEKKSGWNDNMKTGIIVIIVIFGLMFLLLIIIMIYCICSACCRRRRDHSIAVTATAIQMNQMYRNQEMMNQQYMNQQYINQQYMNQQYMNQQYFNQPVYGQNNYNQNVNQAHIYNQNYNLNNNDINSVQLNGKSFNENTPIMVEKNNN